MSKSGLDKPLPKIEDNLSYKIQSKIAYYADMDGDELFELATEIEIIAAQAVQEALQAERDQLIGIIDWATGEGVGVSSKGIVRHMLSLNANKWEFMPPSDAGDRGRCINVLNKIPEWWDRLDEMSQYNGWTSQIPKIKEEALIERKK